MLDYILLRVFVHRFVYLRVGVSPSSSLVSVFLLFSVNQKRNSGAKDQERAKMKTEPTIIKNITQELSCLRLTSHTANSYISTKTMEVSHERSLHR